MYLTLDLLVSTVGATRQWRLLKLTQPDGRVGYGECSDSGTLDQTVETLRLLAPRLVSAQDAVAAGPRGVLAWADAGLGSIPSTRIARTVLGGLEHALCDLSARERGLPVWQWLRGSAAPERAHAPIPCYANINRVPGGRAPADVARAAAEALAAGFTAVKCAPFDVECDGLPLARAGLERIVAVREAVGDDIDLMVDFHARLSVEEALLLLPELERVKVGWLEDIVEIEDVDGLARLREATDIALVGGEFAHSSEQIRPAVEKGLIDVVMTDVKHAGGITRAHELATAFPEIPFSVHNPTGPVGTAAGAHLFRALPNATVLEYAHGEVPWRSALVAPAERVSDGLLALPDGPGLALSIPENHPHLSHFWQTTIEESS